MDGTDQRPCHTALPAIRARLEARHGDLDGGAVERCMTRAIEDTSAARIQTYRAILVEGRADRLLCHDASMKVQVMGRQPNEDVGHQLTRSGLSSSDGVAEASIRVAGGAR